MFPQTDETIIRKFCSVSTQKVIPRFQEALVPQRVQKLNSLFAHCTTGIQHTQNEAVVPTATMINIFH